jgi:hypothetical protein
MHGLSKYILNIFFISNFFYATKQNIFDSDNAYRKWLISKHQHFFEKTNQRKYFEREMFLKKLSLEVKLKRISDLYETNLRDFLNQLHANYLNDLLNNQMIEYVSFNYRNNSRIYKQLNQTWFTMCSQHTKKCIRECLNSNILLSYKRHWCIHNRNHLRTKRSLLINSLLNDTNNSPFFISKNTKISDDVLLHEIMDEIMKKNLKNNFVYLKNLADSIDKTNKMQLKYSQASNLRGHMREYRCKAGFKYESDNDECVDINECEQFKNKSKICDDNALCENTHGSYRCRCNKGYVGDGRAGNCYNAKFCSGRYCRLNGECLFINNLHGYKCQCMLKCLNGGKCIMTRYKYECKCPNNLTGIICNESIEYNVLKRKTNGSNLALDNLKYTENVLLSELVNLVQPLNFTESNTITNLLNYTNQLNSLQMYNFLKRNLTQVNRQLDELMSHHEKLHHFNHIIHDSPHITHHQHQHVPHFYHHRNLFENFDGSLFK